MMLFKKSPSSTNSYKAASKGNSNNFDVLRFFLAFTVLLIHASYLSSADSLQFLPLILSSEVAVKSFFVVSGFLIFMSWENSSSIKSYFSKRIRRIYPAYVTVILICAVLGALVSSQSPVDYFGKDLAKYLIANLSFVNFIQPNLPGVFESNHLQAVNGALWTLKIEVMFYLIVPIVSLVCVLYGRFLIFTLIFLASAFYSVLMGMYAHHSGSGMFIELQRQLPGQLTFFIVGAAGYYYFSFFNKYALWLVVGAVAAIFLKVYLPWELVEPLVIGILVIIIAAIFPPLGNFAKHGDLSYGIYILHFPVLQLFVISGMFNRAPYLALLSAIAVVLLLAFALWHLIERPFLSKASHYVSKT